MAIELKQQTAPPPSFAGLSELTARAKARSHVSQKERMFFTEQLALLLETGSNLHTSLVILKEQVASASMKKLVDALVTDISEGKSFSYALSRHPKVFSQTYVNLIAASEDGGFMHEVLSRLLEMDEKREALRNTMTSALSYPVFLMLFALGVVIFVLVVVFPKFGDMFAAIEDQLPLTTTILMTLSDYIRYHWMYILVGLVTALLLLRTWARSPGGIQRLDQLKLSLPGLQGIFVKLYLVQSLRVMSLSLSNGVGILDTLKACKEVVANRVYQEFIADMEEKVQSGSGISPAFAEAKFIPAVVEQMIATGEESGSLPKVMARLADFYERELEKRLHTLSKLAEPVMLLVMGVVVGLLVSSLILPIFKLSRAVH